jgi:hypothetical protein
VLPDAFWAVPKASGPLFKFCHPVLVFDGTEGDEYRFLILHARAHFRQHRECLVSFSCFALRDSFSAVPRASGLVFHVLRARFSFRRNQGRWVPFHVLLSRTHIRRCGGRRVPFSCFALPNAFWAVPRASGPFFMFCAPVLVFGRTEGIGYRFHFLRARTGFQRNRGRRVPFSCFALPDAFWAVLRASGPLFMSCAPGHIFLGTEGDRYRFHVLRS